MTWQIRQGDALERLQAMPGESVQACVTSPPYFGLRDYGVDGQIGLEATLDEYLDRLLAVFAEVHRVLRSDGTLWVNIGDSYASKPRGSDNGWDKSRLTNPARVQKAQSASLRRSRHSASAVGAKQKDLMGVPWLLAFALREQGWWLREDIIWAKPTPMPESVTDRCTRAHEYIFRLTKSARYYADQDAIREPLGANKRSVWTVRGTPYPAAHFATFPPELVEPMILAGSREGDTVLDPFSGAGTTGLVALRHNRSYIGCELNPEYAELSRRRITADAPLLNSVLEVA
jgi:site-specific DNA-methyltransferase (adenine-specific)